MRTIMVENCEDRIHCIADLPLRVTPAVQATSAGAPLPPKDALLPGLNEVDEAAWEQAEKIELVKHYLSTGALKVTRSAPEIGKYQQREALDLVKRTVDRSLLEKWSSAERRRPVLDAIELQMKNIEVPKEK
jgi:hypothetical protein